jgi:hypothetical protein
VKELFYEKYDSWQLQFRKKCWSFLIQYLMFNFLFFARTTWTVPKTKGGYIPLAEGYPAAQGEYLDFPYYTIPTVGPN